MNIVIGAIIVVCLTIGSLHLRDSVFENNKEAAWWLGVFVGLGSMLVTLALVAGE